MHELRSQVFSEASPPKIDPQRPRSRVLRGSSLTDIPVKRTESRVTNQRRTDRLPGLVGETILLSRRRRYPAQVLNLSSSGAMIACAAGLRIGESVSLRLDDGDPARCLVRWIREDRVGLEFTGVTLFIGQAADGALAFRRAEGESRKKAPREERQNLVWLASLIADGESIPIRLRNVSAGGALIETPRPLDIGLAVLLDLSGAGMVTGVVRWCEGNHAGIRFERVVDLHVFANVSARAGGSAPNEWLKPDYLSDELDPASPWAARWEKLRVEDLG